MPAYNSEEKLKATIADGILQVELSKELKSGRYWIEVRA
jgi:HSP20 family molecular chaperone IbpA